MDFIDNEAETVLGVSCPVLARIDGWPNLLPDALFVGDETGTETHGDTETMVDDTGLTGVIESDAVSVSGVNCPVLASMDGCPYLLPDGLCLVTLYVCLLGK